VRLLVNGVDENLGESTLCRGVIGADMSREEGGGPGHRISWAIRQSEIGVVGTLDVKLVG